MQTHHNSSRFPIGHPNHPNAVPRHQPSDEPELRNGVEWVRNFPRICPFCLETIYTWAPVPWPTEPTAAWTPGVPDTFLDVRSGHQITCGASRCIEEARMAHEAFCAAYYARMDARVALDRAARENDERIAKMENERYV